MGSGVSVLVGVREAVTDTVAVLFAVRLTVALGIPVLYAVPDNPDAMRSIKQISPMPKNATNSRLTMDDTSCGFVDFPSKQHVCPSEACGNKKRPDSQTTQPGPFEPNQQTMGPGPASQSPNRSGNPLAVRSCVFIRTPSWPGHNLCQAARRRGSIADTPR